MCRLCQGARPEVPPGGVQQPHHLEGRLLRVRKRRARHSAGPYRHGLRQDRGLREGHDARRARRPHRRRMGLGGQDLMGTIPPNPTELLEDGKFATLMQILRNEYDYIFVDCPPIDIVADTQIIEQYADRTLFVIRAGLLDRSLLSALETFYQKKRFKNLAIVLNGTESTGGRYGYRYGYSFGYHNAYTSYYGNK